jgi:hypothetical protein
MQLTQRSSIVMKWFTCENHLSEKGNKLFYIVTRSPFKENVAERKKMMELSKMSILGLIWYQILSKKGE